MVECKKEEAFRAREIAIKKMESNDFVGARKIVLEAQRLFPELESLSHLLTVCNVHCVAEVRVNGEMDWYGIFRVEETANETIIRKQYLNLISSLHTDKKRFPGDEAAFKLISEAYSILYVSMKRYRYDIKMSRNVFWTKCPSCKTQYQYYFRILNKKVYCQQCGRRFFALEQAMPTSLSAPIPVKSFCCSQQGHDVKPPAGQVADVEIQFSTLNQDRSSVPTENDNMHARVMPDPPNPNMVGTHNSGIEDALSVADATQVPSSAKHSSACEKTDEKPSIGQSVMLREGVGIQMENNNTGARSMPYSADPKFIDLENLGTVEDDEVLSAAAETGKRKQGADENTILSSDSNKRQRNNDSPSAHVDTSCKQISDDDATSADRQLTPPTHASSRAHMKEKVKTTGACYQDTDSSPEQDTTLQENTCGANQLSSDQPSPCIYKYTDPEFHRFEEDRSPEMFKCGQIWALYDAAADTFPKLYGCITKVEPDPFAVRLIWLEACPQKEQEKQWLEQGLSISCGTFRVVNRGARYDTTCCFSHLVEATGASTLFDVEILPQVGEVWAMYMNWAPDWSPSSINACEFALVEIISRSEAGTKVMLLTKVDGYVVVFRPDNGRGLLEIPTGENTRFAHRIPCFRLIGEGGSEHRVLYKLDPPSVPNGFLCSDLRGHPVTCKCL